MSETYFVEPQPMPETEHAFAQRWGAINDIRTLRGLQVNLPELRSEARGVYDRIMDAERRLVAPNLLRSDYGNGRAVEDDEVYQAWANDRSALLIGADHATDPVRKATGIREGADHGTAGLAAVLAKDMATDLILPRGCQTGNAAVTPDYPYKNEIRSMIVQGRSTGVLSLHGMRPGHVLNALESVECHGLIGLGAAQPHPETLEAVRYLQQKASADLGLRVLVSNDHPHLIYEPAPERVGVTDKINRIKVDEHGHPVRSRLAALGEGSVANFVMRETAMQGITMPTFQLEISRSIRLTPKDSFERDQGALVAGVYMGYLLTKLAVEGMQASNKERA